MKMESLREESRFTLSVLSLSRVEEDQRRIPISFHALCRSRINQTRNGQREGRGGLSNSTEIRKSKKAELEDGRWMGRARGRRNSRMEILPPPLPFQKEIGSTCTLHNITVVRMHLSIFEENGKEYTGWKERKCWLVCRGYKWMYCREERSKCEQK